MYTATARVILPTTITGSIPRPSWYTENVGARPFRDALADARFREQYTDAVGAHLKDQERAGLDIVTDGDARLDADVGGMSWFQYPARRFKGVAGHDYYKTRKGYGGTAKGDILFEVMESRVMPRCVDAIARGPLHYTATWKLAQGLTTRPVKFGTITPELIGTSIGNDHYANQEDLLHDISDAMREELLELARWAPNHHLTAPWRFRVLGPGALARLRQAAGPEGAAKLDRAPTLIVVSCALGEDPLQNEEDLHATAVASYIVLLAAHGRGLAGYWRTPAVLREAEGREAVGLPANERFVGLLHLGNPRQEKEPPQRPPIEQSTVFLD